MEIGDESGGKARFHGGLVGRIGDGSFEESGRLGEGGHREVEFTTGTHDDRC